MRIGKRGLGATVSVMAVCLGNMAATAQEGAGPKTEKTDDPVSVFQTEPVVIDARRWQETLDRIPGSVSVFGKSALDRPMVDDLAVIAKKVPNVQIEQSTILKRVVIRGMTATDTSMQDPVGYFVNDVALPHGAMQAPRLFDADSMEIIKGPQGTLYGRNTEAGAIKVSTATPDWSNSAEMGLETYFEDGARNWVPGYVANARVSGVIVPDKAAVSFALRGETTDGVYYNQYDDSKKGGDDNNFTSSAGLSIWAGDDTEITLKSVIDRQNLGKQRIRYTDGARATDRFVTNYNSTSYDDSLSAVQSLRVDHDFDGLKLTSVSGWAHYDRDFEMDLDAWTLPSLPTQLSNQNDALSQEVRLSSDQPGSDWRWLAGLYGFYEWSNTDFRFSTPRTTRLTDIEQTGAAAFGQVEVNVTEKVRLGGGARLERISQEGSQHYDSGTGNRAYYADHTTTTTVLPKVSLSYDVSDGVMAYASYARGYLPGGYNYAQSTDISGFTYDPEYSWTAETGVKLAAFDGQLTTDLSLFHTKVTDMQIIDFVVGGNQKVSNAGEAEIYGLEVSADGRVTEEWSVYGSFGLQHAEATSYRTTTAMGATQDFSGNRLPMAASYTYAAGLSYRQNGENGWFGQAGLNGSGPYYFNSQNTARQDAYAITDAEIGYRLGRSEVSLWMSNIFDQETYRRATATMAGMVVEDGQARTIGVNWRVKW
ncbi:hypothetical protein TH25_01675 [Thalassospira profundimaris]|uniref:TonB-dependent receptor n=1 Tax=Thalassospira profundimaris TaxID=502049 RepID=A0A367XK87_9PROT|nr:TonB-dependent receptor [Thalassospira profundimaris]RCK54077.1 hypothetical protein TH25_01675 [Thalassospira profundimaris]